MWRISGLVLFAGTPSFLFTRLHTTSSSSSTLQRACFRITRQSESNLKRVKQGEGTQTQTKQLYAKYRKVWRFTSGGRFISGYRKVSRRIRQTHLHFHSVLNKSPYLSILGVKLCKSTMGLPNASSYFSIIAPRSTVHDQEKIQRTFSMPNPTYNQAFQAPQLPSPSLKHSLQKKLAQLPAVGMQKLPGSFCCYSNLSPRVIQPSFDAQSLCIMHSECTKTSTYSNRRSLNDSLAGAYCMSTAGRKGKHEGQSRPEDATISFLSLSWDGRGSVIKQVHENESQIDGSSHQCSPRLVNDPCGWRYFFLRVIPSQEKNTSKLREQQRLGILEEPRYAHKSAS
ncbi:putative signal peptide protein [Puccinia sorghi]|uniref:Putative signal peptide protein n=1 Tax=Puccinia sorghi TaxID=27349 RepID=A0A0L6UCY0_9BASI|nr:putative signal peptide protein [Puccinia sorghi]